MNMDVDVVIPLYNAESWITKTVESALGQTLRPKRIIVVDNASTDSSFDVVSRLRGVELTRCPRKGSIRAREQGFHMTDSPLVAFLDQDDIWHPRHLELICGVLKEHPEAAVAGTFYRSFTDGEEPVFDISSPKTSVIQPWDIFPSLMLACNPSISLFRRAVLTDKVWEQRYQGVWDYTLWMFATVSHPAVRIDIQSVAYRKHGSSMFCANLKDPFRQVELWRDVSLELSRLPVQIEQGSLANRALIVRYIEELLSAFHPPAPVAIGRTCEVLAECLSREPEGLRYLLLQSFVTYLGLDFFNNGRTRRCCRHYGLLLEHWPPGSAVRKQLIRVIANTRPGLSFYLSHYFARPFRLQGLEALVETLRGKLSGTLHQDTLTPEYRQLIRPRQDIKKDRAR